MRILLVGHDASLTGAPKSLLKIAKVFKEANFDTKIILRKSGPLIDVYLQELDVKIWFEDLSNKSLLFKLKNKVYGGHKGREREIIKWVSNYKPDIIFNNTIVNGDILEKLKTFNIPIISRVPELNSVFNYYNLDRSAFKVLEYSNHFIAVSESVRRFLINDHNISSENITLINGFVEQEEFSSFGINNKDFHNNCFVVGNIGSLIYRKGFDLFIDVAEKFTQRFPSVNSKFIWVGVDFKSMQYFEIIEDIKKRNLTGVIQLIEKTKEPEKYYNYFDIFFLSSREDPFPLVMIEAARYSKPIIGFRSSGGIEEFLCDFQYLLADYSDTEQIVTILFDLFNNEKRRLDIGSELRKRSLNFTPESAKFDLLNLIRVIKN